MIWLYEALLRSELLINKIQMKKQKPPRRGKLLEDSLETLANRLTVAQIKYAFSQMSKSPEKGRQDKKALVENLLTCGANTKEIEDTIYEIEAAAAPKHFFVAQSSNVSEFQMPTRHRVFNADRCPNTKRLELVYWKDNGDQFHLTFQHKIEVSRLVQKDEDTWKREKESILHPVFVRLHKAKNLVCVAYPGYEASSFRGDPNKLTYEKIVNDTLNVLKTEYSISISSLPVKQALDFLVVNGSTRVFRQKADPDYKFGKIIVRAKEGVNGIENALANFIKHKNLNESDVKEAIIDALKTSSLNSLVVVWVDEELVSRIEFWESGSEFLFIWRRTVPSYERCFGIFSLIQEAVKGQEQSGDVLNHVLQYEKGHIFKASDISNSVSVSNEKLKAALLEGINLGLVTPVYRLKTESIVREFSNEWTSNLAALSQKFSLENGEEINGRDPKNIEIAFQRSKEVQLESQSVTQ